MVPLPTRHRLAKGQKKVLRTFPNATRSIGLPWLRGYLSVALLCAVRVLFARWVTARVLDNRDARDSFLKELRASPIPGDSGLA